MGNEEDTLKKLFLFCLLWLSPIVCLGVDAKVWEFLGIPGNHTYDWYDYTYPGPSFASADFVYGNYSQANVIAAPGSFGYGDVYSDFVTIDTAAYPYLKIKVDAVLNTSTTWAIGICTFQPDNWLGDMNFAPMSAPNTATGYYCWDYNSAFVTPGVHHFSVSIYITGVAVDEDHYYGYDGNYITVDYVCISDNQLEREPIEATPRKKRKHNIGLSNSWLKNGVGGGWGNQPLGFGYDDGSSGGRQ